MAKSFLLLLLKILMILLAVVWISIWVMKPTQIWTTKWKEAEETARITVFGSYGLDFIVYSLPIMISVMIGFVYMHFKQPQEQGGRRRKPTFISSLSNPIIVNRFIGVLSAMEVFVIFIFIMFLAWTLYIHLSNDFKKMMMPLPAAKSLMKLNTWQYITFRTATRCGLLAEACLALLLFPIMRGMSVFRLFGIQFEASVRYHIWLGTLMLSFATLHGAGTLFIWGIKIMLQHQMLQWQKTGRIYLAGEISLVAGLVIGITSLPQVRRKRFEFFYYTHHLYIIFIIFFVFHTGERHLYMVLPAIFIFIIERLLRIIQLKSETCVLSARIFPSKAIQLILPKKPGLKYTPTSIILIKIPSISKFQWHSFSIASSSMVDDDTMSLIIKCDGSWTNSLYDMMIHNNIVGPDQRVQRCIPVSIEGPYGPTSIDFLSKYDSLLLVAGGIGVSPFLSILQEVSSCTSSSNSSYSGRRNSNYPTKIQLVYVVKKSNSISILLLNSINNLMTNLKLKIYVTQETRAGASATPTATDQIIPPPQTLHFQTDDRHDHLTNYSSYGYGTSLLMAAAIIAFTSFLFFLLLLTFTHVFLSAKEKTASSLVDLIVMFAFFLSIIISVMFFLVLMRLKSTLRNKQQQQQQQLMEFNNYRGKEIHFAEASSYLDEHELYFGARPDFHDIFSKFPKETGGSYVGVLVCGPEKMKESVASMCCQAGSITKKPYFSFHSLNFTL